MKEKRSSIVSTMKDPEFDDLLRLAKAVPPLPGAFQTEVWKRLEAKNADSLTFRLIQWIESALTLLVRPMAASVAVILTISAGLWLGTQNSQSVRDPKIAYVESVSPFLHAHQETHR